jgi:two-component system phosphate regulon response regulator OmpR
MKQTQVLICDDEVHLREMIAEYLVARDFDVLQANGPPELRALLAEHSPDLILLDIRMPGEDGLTALRDLRATQNIPVIMLTAASGTVDRVVGLELGADDYLGKPVDLRELEARIKAVLRRLNPTVSTSEVLPATLSTDRVEFGHCALDLESARLFDKRGTEIPITAMEFTLLRLFLRNAGRILTRDQILDETDDRGMDPFDRSIDLRISRLRKKIEANPARPEIIRTVRGLGYIYDGPRPT